MYGRITPHNLTELLDRSDSLSDTELFRIYSYELWKLENSIEACDVIKLPRKEYHRGGWLGGCWAVIWYDKKWIRYVVQNFVQKPKQTDF